MTPEHMAERLAEWVREEWGDGPPRRVDCVEPESERRTWVLTEGSRQVGLVRMRAHEWSADAIIAALGPRSDLHAVARAIVETAPGSRESVITHVEWALVELQRIWTAEGRREADAMHERNRKYVEETRRQP